MVTWNIALEKAFPAQASFVLDRTTRYPALVGGFGSGKTHAGVAKSLDLSVINKGMTGLIVGKTYRHITDILWPKLFDEFLDPAGISQFCKFNKSEKTIRLPWGSTLSYWTAEKPRSIIGFDAAWAWCDEAALCHPLTWIQMGRRMRQPGTVLAQQFVTFTPETYAWTHEKWGRMDLFNEPLPDNYKVYHASTYDNVFLTDEYAAEIASECDPEEAASVIRGRFTNVRKGRVYYTFSQKDNVKAAAVYDPSLPLDLMFDFNKVPGMHIELGQRHRGFLLVVDEVFRKGLTLEDSCKEVLNRYAERHIGTVTVYGDATGRNLASRKSYYHTIVEILRDGMGGIPGFKCSVSMDVPRANPSVADSCAAVRAALCDSMGMRRLIVNPACKRLVADLLGVQYRASAASARGRSYAGNPDDIEKSSDPNLTHASDALRYWIARVRPLRSEFKRQTNYKMRDYAGAIS